MSPPDRPLLDRPPQTGEEQAFAELVRRHLPVVHAAALRLTGSRTLAEEAGQSVFSALALAMRRSALPAGIPLMVWLHRTTRSTALNLLRSENRRRIRERDFAVLHAPDEDPGSGPGPDPRSCPWDRMAPVLDEVIHQLPEAERGLILRRFFWGESHAAIARGMNLSPDAVRMRMNRALERMRRLLRRQGIHTTASALTLSLPSHAAPPVSAALAATVLTAALPGLTTGGGLAVPTLTLLPAALMIFKPATLTAAAVAVLLAAGTVTGFLMLRPNEDTPVPSAVAAGTEVQSPPLPRVGISSPENQAKPEWQRWMEQKAAEAEARLSEEEKKAIRDRHREIMEKELRINPPATPQEVARFLEEGGKTVETLGWAFTRTGNLDYLREGLAREPDSVFLRFLAAALRNDQKQRSQEAALLSQNAMRWLRDHQPAMHAAFQIDGGRPVPLASLEALNNGSFSVIPEDILKKQHEVFLMTVRGFPAEKAADYSNSAGRYSLKSMMLTAAVLSPDPAAGLVSAQAVSRTGGLVAEFVGLSQERVRYAKADEARLRELVGDSRENLLAAVDREMREVKGLMDLQGDIAKNGAPEQVEELRRMTAEMGERAALEQLRNKRAAAAAPPPPGAP